MKQFVFLYPMPEIIDWEIKNGSYGVAGGEKTYRLKYKTTFNECIDLRYRQKGFAINFAVFNGSPVSEVVELCPADRVIEVGLDFNTHRTKQPNGKYPYPDPDYLLDQLGEAEFLVIAGFHMWDCVEKMARRVFERGMNVLVDEDLTEFFAFNIKHPDFAVGKYPSLDFRKIFESSTLMSEFLEARKHRPWLWQNY